MNNRKPTPLERDLAQKAKRLERLIAKMPKHMHPELYQLDGLDGLIYRVEVEIDLGANGSTDPKWTTAQWCAAWRYCALLKREALI